MHPRFTLVSLAVAVLFLAAAPALAKQAPGTYRGKTSQKLPIAVVVKKGAISELHFKVKNDCGATNKPIDVSGGSIKIRSNGRFSMNLSNAGGSLKVSGRFDGTKATGTLREQTASPLLSKDTCDTGKVRWSVKL